MAEVRQKVAVIGGGVAGIVSAYLLGRRFDVTLFEKNEYLGGHTNTIVVPSGPDAGLAIDTGFIVLNDKTYPLFHRFLAELKVPVRYADMCFSYSCERTGLEYCSRTVASLFAQRRNLLRPRFLGMLAGLPRFWKAGASDLAAGTLANEPLGEWLKRHKIADSVIQDYLVPISAAIWSSPDTRIMEFPANTFLHFFKNHGLLGYLNQPRWQTVVGGSFEYVKAFKQIFGGRLLLNAGVTKLKHAENSVEVETASGGAERFDYAVVALHADQVLKIHGNPTPQEKAIFGPWEYETNHTVLHTDASFLPNCERAWASWNYRRERDEDGTIPVSITYFMNMLQGFDASEKYSVTLNPRKKIDPSKVIFEVEYTHPRYTVEAIAAREVLLRGEQTERIRYCGSYQGFGFHEDAVASAVRVANSFGVPF